MNLLTFSAVAIPIAVIIGIAYLFLRDRGYKKWSLLLKCLGTAVYVVSAFLGSKSNGRSPFQEPVFWFAVLCMTADLLLELHFVSGMLVFGLAHIVLIYWICVTGKLSAISLLVWAVAMTAAFLLFRKDLLGLKWGMVPFLVYAGILIASFSLGFLIVLTHGFEYVPVAIGAASFFASDMIIARRELSGINSRRRGVLIMLFYWGALYFITASLWII